MNKRNRHVDFADHPDLAGLVELVQTTGGKGASAEPTDIEQNKDAYIAAAYVDHQKRE